VLVQQLPRGVGVLDGVGLGRAVKLSVRGSQLGGATERDTARLARTHV
jgi:hypothetical protein